MRELNVNEVEVVNGGEIDYLGDFVSGCVITTASAAAVSGGMSLPLAGQTCLAGGTLNVIASIIKELFS